MGSILLMLHFLECDMMALPQYLTISKLKFSKVSDLNCVLALALSRCDTENKDIIGRPFLLRQ
jgi:hypothetical protein